MRHMTTTIAAAFAFTAGAAQVDGSAQAGPIPHAGVGATASSVALQEAQYFWGGRNYCWYLDGWQGPGWYWCGYRWRHGYGWGGGYGWHGWGGPGQHGGGWHGGRHYGGWQGGGSQGGGWQGGGGQGGNMGGGGQTGR